MRPGLDNGAFWLFIVLELQIKARMMLTNVIVYPIGHYIMKTTPSIAKIANAGLVFLDNTMGGGWLGSWLQSQLRWSGQSTSPTYWVTLEEICFRPGMCLYYPEIRKEPIGSIIPRHTEARQNHQNISSESTTVSNNIDIGLIKEYLDYIYSNDFF